MIDEIFIKEMSSIDAYNYGRQMMEKEINELGECEYNKGRADAIEEYMNRLCDKCIQTPNECWNLECPFADDECQIVKIAEQLKELK